MEYKIIINNQEYQIPKIIYMFNQKLFEQYTKIKDNELYLDIEAMKNDKKYNEMKIITDQSCNAIGMFSLEDEDEMKEMIELGPKMRFLDDMAKINYEKGKEELAFQKLTELLTLSLSIYKKQLEKEELNMKEIKSR